MDGTDALTWKGFGEEHLAELTRLVEACLAATVGVGIGHQVSERGQVSSERRWAVILRVILVRSARSVAVSWSMTWRRTPST